MNQAIGKGMDYLANENGWDNGSDGTGRVMQTLASLYLNSATRFYSHELAHDRVARSGGDTEQGFDFTDFSRGFPGWEHTVNYNISKELHNKEMFAGLNQDELNAKYMHEKTKNDMTFDEGIGFLATKFRDVTYNLLVRDDLDNGWSDDEYNKTDVAAYSAILKNQKEIDLSKNEYLVQSLAADLLSMKTWDAFRAIGNYIVNGERTTDTTKFMLGGVSVVPPLFSTSLTDRATFMNSQTTVETGVGDLEIELGSDLDFMGGELNTVRGGVKLNLPSFAGVEVSPFAYVTKSDNTGYDIGVEAAANLTKNISLTGKLGAFENDIIRDIKGDGNGFKASIGMRWKL